MNFFRRLFNQTPTGPSTPPQSRPSAARQPHSPPAASAGAAHTPVRDYFDALNVTDQRSNLPLQALPMFGALSAWKRSQLTAVARYLWDNIGTVFYATDLIANYSLPMVPRASSRDRDWNEQANDYFDEWATRADWGGQLDFYDVQRIASYTLDIEGEAFALWVDDNGVPKLQLVEAWRFQTKKDDDLVSDGIQTDRTGRIVAYWLDGEKRLDASHIVHLLEPDRIESRRGVSPIRRGANDIRDGADIKTFQKLLSKLSTTLTLAIEGDAVEDEVWGTAPAPAGEDDPVAETTPTTSDEVRNYTVAELIGGDIPVIPDGRKLKQVNSPSAPSNNIESISYLAGCFVAGLGLPPAFFLDEKLTGPNQRAVNGKAQRRFDRRKLVVGKLARSAWHRVIGAGIASGALPSSKEWTHCDFIGPSKITIDAGREMAQEREDVMSGLMSRRDHYGARGRPWRRETEQVFAEIDYILQRCKELSQTHGIPLETLAASFGITASRTTSQAPSKTNNEPDQTADGNTPD